MKLLLEAVPVEVVGIVRTTLGILLPAAKPTSPSGRFSNCLLKRLIRFDGWAPIWKPILATVDGNMQIMGIPLDATTEKLSKVNAPLDNPQIVVDEIIAAFTVVEPNKNLFWKFTFFVIMDFLFSEIDFSNVQKIQISIILFHKK